MKPLEETKENILEKLRKENQELRMSKVENTIEIQTLSELRDANWQLSEEKFSKVFHINPLASGLTEIESGKYVDVNEAFCSLFGYDKNEIIGKDPIELGILTAGIINRVVAQSKSVGSKINIEVDLNSKNGEIKHVLLFTDVINFRDSRLRYTVVQDITEQKQAEAALKQSELNYRTLFENSMIGISQTSLDGRLIRMNAAYAEMFGYNSPTEMMAEVPNVIKLYAQPEKRAEILKNLADKGFSEPKEFEVFRRDGSTIFVLVSGKVVKDNDGNIYCYQGEHIDITEQKKAEEALKNSEKKFRSYFENIQDVYYEATVDGLVTEVSPSIGIISRGQYSRDDLIGKSMADFYANPDDRAAFYLEIIKNGSVTDYELMLKNKDGSLFPISISSKIFFDAQGNPKNIVGSMRDIADRKLAEIELIASKEKAEESDHLKSAFLANMSHEIRTPMNGILGFTSLLKEPTLTTEERNEYISVIEQSGVSLLTIINDILEISKIESGQMGVNISDVHINEIIDDLYIFFKPQIDCDQIEFNFQYNLTGPQACVKSDYSKINAILINLIKNAIKFTNIGLIEFGYIVKGNMIEFFVKDTGIGIQKDRLNAIFERFVQADISLSREYEGTGLGLSIAKAYVKMLGGEIWVESEFGKGTTFYFTIPMVN